ncbi:uncharacterized protein [Phaseolus vulgaris]|uniref:uncharacterized protein n=1 Tax=Phaseolus vulgaris TaxID=3885 RepID=UPI0035CBB0C4
MSIEDNVGYASSSHGRTKPVDNIGSMTNMLYDAYMQEVDITSHYDHMDTDDEYVEESPNAKPKAPKDNCIPKNYYKAKKIVSNLGLKAQNIDCCEAGCMLYYKDDNLLIECKFCHLPRYFPPKGDKGRYKQLPRKRMFYLPIIPRLQRLYASVESAKQMRWHFENKKEDGILRHPCHGEAWKHLDKIYSNFAIDPQHVRLGLCSDGFTPYVQASTSPYSCWSVFLTPYNLLPEMCVTKPYMWNEGVMTYDISTRENFVMRACLMWKINDFPTYGMLSGWGTKGKLACPRCMEDTKAFTLPHGGKSSWFDCHRRFLPTDHPFRRSKRRFTKNRIELDGPPNFLNGEQLWEFIRDFPKVTDGPFDTLLGYEQYHNWTKRSIFWDLPYWKHNLLRHNLDVMHIEKNFFDNVFNTEMDVKDKTKDNHKARMDVAEFCGRGDLELVQLRNGKLGKPKANYTFTKKDAKSIYKWITKLKMPDVYASNIFRCANTDKGSMHSMKRHDCHVFMECLLPIAFRSLPEFVWNAIAEISRFFRDLCCFFDLMEHLVIHLSTETILGGPVQYRWMYPFESLLSNTSLRNDPRTSSNEGVESTLSVLNKCDRPSGSCKEYLLNDDEYRSTYPHQLQ